MKRAIVVVIDSMGIGAMPDCKDFGDVPECNTLKNVCKFNHGLKAPNLSKLGLGNIQDFEGIAPEANPIGQYGTMKEKSNGKDTTTGHWEIAGIILPEAFKTFTATGFPQDIIDEFVKRTNCGGILANCAASGTQVIVDYNDEHQKTKYPIIYTSADSVFQIAVDVDVIPLDTLYEWCKIARKMFDDIGVNVSRVIARPYHLENGVPTRISKSRRDYVLAPDRDTILTDVEGSNGTVIAIGKIEDIFCKQGVTHAIHTGGNTEGLELTLKAINNTLDLKSIEYKNVPNADKSLIFTNLVDTDMLYGHRNDAAGYGKAIEEIDTYIPKFIDAMTDDDYLVITADHGCDPTTPGTDHTREYVPILIYNKKLPPKDLGMIDGFDSISKLIKQWIF